MLIANVATNTNTKRTCVESMGFSQNLSRFYGISSLLSTGFSGDGVGKNGLGEEHINPNFASNEFFFNFTFTSLFRFLNILKFLIEIFPLFLTPQGRFGNSSIYSNI